MTAVIELAWGACELLARFLFPPGVVRRGDKDDSFMRQPKEKRALLTSLRGFGQNP